MGNGPGGFFVVRTGDGGQRRTAQFNQSYQNSTIPMNYSEIFVFVLYLIAMLAIGIYFFFKDRNGGEKTYFLGDRKMGAWVAALSAGASDMSAWVLMGLPTAIYAAGIGQAWISVGLAAGYATSWIIQAPRLRRFSIVADDAITVPQYLTNRFLTRSRLLQVISAVVFLLAYTIYAASSIKACGILFHKVVGMDTTNAMYLSAFIIVGYTFLGGFSAVCWTDFIQGLLIVGAMFLAPIFAAFVLQSANAAIDTPNFWNPFAKWTDVVSGLTWGLGYFGMPHIIIRFMSIKSQKELRKSSVIGISWTALVVIFAVLIGLIGRMKLGLDDDICKNELVFIQMGSHIFPGLISGVLLSAVLAASMSTADSQLLAASSAFSSDFYKPVVRGSKAHDAELMWIGRLVVLIVAETALIIATNPNAGSIMNLVSNAWGVFGASFGPAIMLSLFWKRFNMAGAVAGIIGGAVVDIAWLCTLSGRTGIFELLPGFAAGMACAVAGTLLTRAPSPEVQELFAKAVSYRDEQ